jgi:hypothetical protein
MASVAELLQDQLEPFLADDSANGNALATFLTAIGLMYEDVKVWADDDDEGDVGWSILLDLSRCPATALPWLGQFVGARVNANLSDSDQRQQVSDVAAWKRGSVAAMIGAVKPYLTGTQSIIFSERDSGACPSEPAYGLTIFTLTDETPDSGAVLAALLLVKPAGIVLNYHTVSGATYEALFTTYATYEDLYGAYDTYRAILAGSAGIDYGSGIYGSGTYGG